MTTNKVDASAIRRNMHKAVDTLLDVIESCPPEAFMGSADGEEITFLGDDTPIREREGFASVESDYGPESVYQKLSGLDARNEFAASINKDIDLAPRQAEWDAQVAAGETPKWNRPRPLPITLPRDSNGYHLLDEKGDSLQELFRENLY